MIIAELRNISKVSNIVRIILKFFLILRSFGQANPRRPHFLTASRYETYTWIHGVRTRGLSFCSEQWDCSHSLWVFFSPIKSSSARSEKLWEQWFLNCSQEKSSQSNGFRSDPTKKFSEHFFTERSDEFSLNFTVWRPILEWIDLGSILTSKIS